MPDRYPQQGCFQLVQRNVLRIDDVTAGKCLRAAQVHDRRVRIDQPDGRLRLDVGNAARLATKLGEDQHKEADQQCADQDRVVA